MDIYQSCHYALERLSKKGDKLKLLHNKLMRLRPWKSIIEKLKELDDSSIILLQEVGHVLFKELQIVYGERLISTKTPDFLGEEKEEYRLAILPSDGLKNLSSSSHDVLQKMGTDYRSNLLFQYKGLWICNIHLYHKKGNEKEFILSTLELAKTNNRDVITDENSGVLFVGATNNVITESIQMDLGFKVIKPSEPTFYSEINGSNILDGYFFVNHLITA